MVIYGLLVGFWLTDIIALRHATAGVYRRLLFLMMPGDFALGLCLAGGKYAGLAAKPGRG